MCEGKIWGGTFRRTKVPGNVSEDFSRASMVKIAHENAAKMERAKTSRVTKNVFFFLNVRADVSWFLSPKRIALHHGASCSKFCLKNVPTCGLKCLKAPGSTWKKARRCCLILPDFASKWLSLANAPKNSRADKTEGKFVYSLTMLISSWSLSAYSWFFCLQSVYMLRCTFTLQAKNSHCEPKLLHCKQNAP